MTEIPSAADVVMHLDLSGQDALDALALAESIAVDAFKQLSVAAAVTRFPKAVLILGALALARALVTSVRKQRPELFEMQP